MRKKKPEEHENHERWLVSYADFITLLFAFFVVMYSVSSVNEGKYRVLSESLDAAFKSSNKSMMPIQIGQAAKIPKSRALNLTNQMINIGLSKLPPPRYSEVAAKLKKGEESDLGHGTGTLANTAGKEKTISTASEELKKAMAPLIKKGLIEISSDGQWIEIEINSSILFPSGSAKLSTQAIPIMENIAKTLSTTKTSIQVEGFTDNIPINTLLFPSNWELSAARSASVVHLFSRTGLVPNRMAAIGYGEYHPIASNKTVAGRQKNRRVVLVVNAINNKRLLKSKERFLKDEKRLEKIKQDKIDARKHKVFLKKEKRRLFFMQQISRKLEVIKTLKKKQRKQELKAQSEKVKEQRKPGVFPIFNSPIEVPGLPAFEILKTK